MKFLCETLKALNPRMMPGFDVYRTYLAMKQHFTKKNFDFFQYDGKVRAKQETYLQRSDFYFFETLARKLSDTEVKEYLLASFVSADDPSKVWIGDIKRSGKDRWLAWTKQNQSMQYLVKQDLSSVANFLEEKGYSFNDLFETLGGHPPALKLYIQRRISLETLIVMDMVLKFTQKWDENLHDPLWESLSLKIKKYKPFLSIPTHKYKKFMKETFL
jgi:hypothetical protein